MTTNSKSRLRLKRYHVGKTAAATPGVVHPRQEILLATLLDLNFLLCPPILLKLHLQNGCTSTLSRAIGQEKSLNCGPAIDTLELRSSEPSMTKSVTS